ncbi:helix-turn-helix transcriptional regulator [Providencia stuartii]|uniref:helix-turn-helix transcriptional regulator n=1 Tax=Providencia stuartii TaxID=588 RepID=UPI0034E39452
MTNPIETSTVTMPSLLNDQFIDMKFITQLTGLTDKWFYKLIQDGEFPKPIKLGRSSRWLKSEVEQWLQARIDESREGNSALGS